MFKRLVIMICLISGQSLVAQLRGDTCVVEMNTINSDLSDLVKDIEKITHTESFERLEAGIAYFEKGKRAQADTAFRKAVSLFDGCYQGYGYLGWMSMENGHNLEAVEFFEASVKAFNRYCQYAQHEGKEALKRCEDELKVLTHRLESLSAKSTLIDGVGSSYNTQDKMLKIREVEKRISFVLERWDTLKDTSFPELFRLKYGNTLFGMNRFSEALNQYLSGLVSQPESPALNANTAVCYFLTQHPTEAIQYYRKAKSLGAQMNQDFVRDMETLIGEGQ